MAHHHTTSVERAHIEQCSDLSSTDLEAAAAASAQSIKYVQAAAGGAATAVPSTASKVSLWQAAGAYVEEMMQIDLQRRDHDG